MMEKIHIYAWLRIEYLWKDIPKMQQWLPSGMGNKDLEDKDKRETYPLLFIFGIF